MAFSGALTKQARYSACMQHLKTSKWSKSKKESTTNVFGESNARTNVRVMCLEVEIHELRST